MLVYVDFVSAVGRYRPCRHPATVDPAMPLGILLAEAFLDASGAGPRASACRLYHLEGSRFLAADTPAGALAELDTVIVANTDDPELVAAEALARQWHRHGRRASTLGFEYRRAPAS